VVQQRHGLGVPSLKQKYLIRYLPQTEGRPGFDGLSPNGWGETHL